LSRPLEFPNQFGKLLRLLACLILGPFLLALAAEVWLSWTLSPLQKFCRTAYSDSSVGASSPHNLTRIRWGTKTAPKRGSVFAQPKDVVYEANSQLQMKLSAQAIAQGWRNLELRSSGQIESSKLTRLLRETVYQGRSVLWIFGMPVFSQCVPVFPFAPTPIHTKCWKEARGMPRT
jgi:hypothetical protein